MRSWKEYVKQELNREPGILLLAYPYSFLWRDVNEANVKKTWKKVTNVKEKIVYIHIPFCRKKCFFCGFVSFFHTPYDLIKKYVHCLKKEMMIISPYVSHLTTDSLRLGGGTPNLLKEKELADIFRAARRFMNLKKEAEISMEIFPDDSMDAAKLKLMKTCGVNRISMGIQSFDNKIKRACNRFDTRKNNLKIYNLARKIGFDKINFDLIFGLPLQNSRSWLDTLDLTVKLSPEHITIYPLAARHPRILFYEHMKKMAVKNMIDTFNFTRDFLNKKGYRQINRYLYVRSGVDYVYKESFSRLGNVLGLGLNSISYVSNFTYKNTLGLKEYFSALSCNKLPVEKGYMLRGKDIMRNYVFRKITYSKIDRAEFKSEFGKDIKFYFAKVIGILEKNNLVDIDKRSIKLTPLGLFYTALVKRCFFNFKILNKKESFYKNN
jgi:oxygen-independent coproporphyrinogen-3 oxidase